MSDQTLHIAPRELPPFVTPVEEAIGTRTEGTFTRNDLAKAVRADVRDFVEISDADLAWIVEATLVQLGYGLRQCGAADLGYAGSIHRDQLGGENFYSFRPFQGGTDADPQ